VSGVIPRPRHAAGFLLAIVAALLVPSLASAAEYEVNGVGDNGTKTACEMAVGECTLRGAVEAADAGAGLDEITFGEPFESTPSTISLGSTLSLTQPVEIRAPLVEVSGELVPGATVHVSGTAFMLSATETVIEGLGIEATSIGVQILGGLGAEILDNFISGVEGTSPQAGVEVNPGSGIEGNLIEGNLIKVPGYYSWGVAVQYGANQIFGNEIIGGGEGISMGGCCYQGIDLSVSADGNRIGGDTPGSENVITGFWYGAIWDETSNHNEFGRNRGIISNDNFIFSAPTAAPTIAKAYPTKVSGTSLPEAEVRVFATVGEFNGEIEGFLGEAVADSSGEWTAPTATSAVGAHVTATQTFEGGTSPMSATAPVEVEPSSGGDTGGGSSGDGSSGGSTQGTTPPPVTPPPTTTLTAEAPKVKITKGPAKSSKAKTAKFTFKATNVSGATFECKLDKAKWARCKSPKTYKKLKPGRHTFQVRAKASGLTGAVAKFQFTVKP
jgi:hypothetical protein